MGGGKLFSLSNNMSYVILGRGTRESQVLLCLESAIGEFSIGGGELEHIQVFSKNKSTISFLTSQFL